MYDVVIIGGGPAGLTAAVYLGRFLRRCLIIDSASSRARYIPTSHNIPGFTEGVAGTELLAQLRAQATKYGAEIRAGRVGALTRQDDAFELRVAGEMLAARFVLLATGVHDNLPQLAGAADALLRSVLRVCPICDGYEASGRSIAVIGDGDHAEREAQFLRTYSERITYLHIGASHDPQRRERLEPAGVALLETRLDDLAIEEDRLCVRLPDGRVRAFDVAYAALGCTPQLDLVASLGAQCDAAHALIVDAHQRTSIDGLYAAGDVVRGLNQVVVACAEAAIAATDMHNRLNSSPP